MSGFYEQAAERLDKECQEIKANGAVAIMKTEVCKALLEFCKQEEAFAKAIVEGGSFKDCMDKVAENPGDGISDIEAYRRAVGFYFPEAEIHFNMWITLNKTETKGKNSGMLVNLDSFF